MTHTFYIDTTVVNGRQLMKFCFLLYGKQENILKYIVDQTNQCDAKSNKHRFIHLKWSAVHEKKYS